MAHPLIGVVGRRVARTAANRAVRQTLATKERQQEVRQFQERTGLTVGDLPVSPRVKSVIQDITGLL